MNINEYLLKNPKQLEVLFTKIFGKYLIRYYGTNDYSVNFSDSEPTSYQDEKNKSIVISLDNVVAMLEKNINVLAVAYHELAHTLYTSNKSRDDIRKKAVDIAHVNGDFIHNLWNILEDVIIEEKIMQEFPFLKPIVAPLKNLVTEDGLLMDFRKGTLAKTHPLYAIASDYVSPKKKSNKKKAEILADIYTTYYKNNEDFEQQHREKLKKEDEKYKKTNDETTIHDIKQNIEAIEKRIEEYVRKIDLLEEKRDEAKNQVELLETNMEIRRHEEAIEDFQDTLTKRRISLEKLMEEIKEKYGEDFELEPKAPQQVLIDLKNIKTDNSQEQIMKDILIENQQTIIENQELANYNNSIDIPNLINGKPQFPEKVLKVYSAKQRLRNGVSEALSKKYSTDIKPKMSVSRLVSAKANRSEPNIFQSKGKNVEFVKKVVIFEDISSSTGMISEVFSSIGYSLSTAFEKVEWWGYSDKLWEKPKQYYEYGTKRLGYDLKVSTDYGTQAFRLLNVMKKYKNQDNTYVIITDGDMESVFQNKELWSFFNDKCIVIGVLNDNIKKQSKHFYEFDNKKIRDAYFYGIDQKEKLNLISKSVHETLQLIESRLK